MQQYCNWMDLYLSQLETEGGYQGILGLNKNIPDMVHICKELLCCTEGNIWEIVVMIIDHIEIGDPLKEEGIQIGMEDCLIEGGILIGIEDLLEEEDILEEDPLVNEDPLMVEDPLMEMEDPLDPPVDKDHQVLKDLPDQ